MVHNELKLNIDGVLPWVGDFHKQVERQVLKAFNNLPKMDNAELDAQLRHTTMGKELNSFGQPVELRGRAQLRGRELEIMETEALVLMPTQTMEAFGPQPCFVIKECSA